MSLQGLISGSECAVPANPLSQVLKHTEGDRSLQQDRIAGPSSSRLHHLPGTSAPAANERDLALARQFFDGNSQAPNAHPAFAVPPHLPPTELARMNMLGGSDFGQAWAREQQHQHQPPTPDESKAQAAWAAEFGNAPQLSASPLVQNMPTRPEFQQVPSYMRQLGLYGNPMGSSMYSMNMGQNMYQGMPNISVDHDKGKGKSREADFEAAFAHYSTSLDSTQTETSRIEEVDADTEGITEAMKNTTLDGNIEQNGADFKPIWEQLQNSDLPPPQEDMAKWEAEFNQLMSAQRDELEHDYGADMQQAWEAGLGDYQGISQDEASVKFDGDGLPILGDYKFEVNNKYLGPSTSTRSMLDDAKALLDQGGSLSEAGLLLEAAIQKGELGEGGYEAWILLGETRNMDEREVAGMKALAEGVKRATEAGAAGAGMLSLAISYTNESYDRASHNMLLRWLRSRFPSHPVSEETINAVHTNSSWDTHTRVTEVFINLARIQHQQGILDPDVQIGLGVMFYTNGEYDRAKDCFESALAARPKDYLLWNRLGSSLSNGNKPEEALGAYREALQLRPTYTRAIYNVGVACLNIGAHKEAAEHFLSALTMQEASGPDTSEQLWFTLRRVFLAMERPDLADLATLEARTNLETFRKEGFDF